MRTFRFWLLRFAMAQFVKETGLRFQTASAVFVLAREMNAEQGRKTGIERIA